ncbi:MAG TPA: hypothetical protein VIY47_11740 [Ignavibacteriaceae bacterium]
MGKPKIYSWKEMISIAQKHDGVLSIPWNYSCDQKRNAAKKAAKNGYLKKIRGPAGADHYKIALNPLDPKMIALSQGVLHQACSPNLLSRIKNNVLKKMEGQDWQILDWIRESNPSLAPSPGETLEEWIQTQQKNPEATKIIQSLDDQLFKM